MQKTVVQTENLLQHKSQFFFFFLIAMLFKFGGIRFLCTHNLICAIVSDKCIIETHHTRKKKNQINIKYCCNYIQNINKNVFENLIYETTHLLDQIVHIYTCCILRPFFFSLSHQNLNNNTGVLFYLNEFIKQQNYKNLIYVQYLQFELNIQYVFVLYELYNYYEHINPLMQLKFN